MTKKYFLFIAILIFTFVFVYYILPIFPDEIWCYGFAYNISKGMVPYRDFNMVVTPLYSFILAFFLAIFDRNIIIVCIVNSFMLCFIFLFMYKIINYKAVFIYLFLLLSFALPSYNFFCLLLFFILISLDDKNYNKYCIYSSLLVSFIFLTKQSIGGFLLIPLLYYSRNRLKSLFVFLIPILVFCVYLLFNGAFYNFLDYCFFGLFDFGSKNSRSGILTFFVLAFIILSLILLLKCKFKDSFLFYVLMFFSMCFPDTYGVHHFFVGTAPFFVYLLSKLKISSKDEKILKSFLVIFIIAIVIFFVFPYCSKYTVDRQFNYFSFYNKILDNYDYEKLFVFSRDAYAFKLYNSIPINKYDLINNGNMGYNGANRYILDVENACKDNMCLILISIDEFNDRVNFTQTNLDILDYVYNNYNCSDKRGEFYFCVN